MKKYIKKTISFILYSPFCIIFAIFYYLKIFDFLEWLDQEEQ